MTLTPGTRLGPYEILAPLGAGGMGEVWKAKDTRLDRLVAVKVLPEHLAKNPEALARFEREAKAVAALNHPNILAIHDVGREGEVAFLVMELLEGASLRTQLQQGSLSFPRAVDVAIQLVQGLATAHEKGVVHRDLKPENLWITADGRLKILDFGLAKQVLTADPGADSRLPTAAMGMLQEQPTQEGQILGTIGYMSPEQVRGQAIDQRSDLFSVGEVLYEMLSGQRAFQRNSMPETMAAILLEEPKDLSGSATPTRMKAILHRLLEKNIDRRYQRATEVLADLKGLEAAQAAKGWRLSRTALAGVGVASLLAALLAGLFLRHERSVRRARLDLLPRAEQLLSEAKGPMDFPAVFALVAEAEKLIPDDPRLKALFARVAGTTSFTSEPAGAVVSIRPYADPNAPWQRLGVTPLQNLRLPASVFVIRFEKAGYEPVLAASLSFKKDLSAREYKPVLVHRVLDQVGTLPSGMVHVTGQKDLPDFFMDATEVTNQAYKAFVDAGGYRTKAHWKELLTATDGAKGWPAAMAGFVDETGRPGPATWRAGDFPAGQAQFPVSGVNWYEAAAFASWAGKSLPTINHWRRAFTAGIPATLLTTLSNFEGMGPTQVASHPAISAFGAYDMAGNVREWCWNESPGGRVLRGGAWDDIPYMATSVSQTSPKDRSPKNGFRCMRLVEPTSVPAATFASLKPDSEFPDFYKIPPATDAVFRVYREQFAYDKADLGATIEWRNESARDWVQEKVTFNAAYDGERMTLYLFLPKGASLPYQTVVYFPGSGSQDQRSSQDLDKYWEFEQRLTHYLKSGRAVVYPIYKGTFERGSEAIAEYAEGATTHQYTDLFIKMVKDFRRTLDYLETRPELDHGRVAYLGTSWGGQYGAIIPAVEERLRVNLVIVGGLRAGAALTEVDQIHYIGRVKIPTLMLNGRYDFTFPYTSSAKPMFDLLGTPPDKKLLKLYESDHYIPNNELVKETLAWLDKYLGPVR